MNNSADDTEKFVRHLDFADTFFSPSLEPFLVTFGAASDVGNVRERNEDQFAILRMRRELEVMLASLSPDELPSNAACSYAMVVADGMGGMKSGDIASRVALQTMVSLANQASSWVTKLTDNDAQQIEERVDAYVRRIHAKLQQQGRADASRKSMGTTWTSAHLLGRSAVIVHLGDSRAYLFRDGSLVQLTRDETMAQALIDSGVEASTVGKFRHILLNSFGGGNTRATASTHNLEVAEGDQLLVCSDGLTDMVSDPDIAFELSRFASPQSTCETLVKRALANGGRDNVTVTLAVIGSEDE